MNGKIYQNGNNWEVRIGPNQSVALRLEPGDVLTRGLKSGDTADVISLRQPTDGIEAQIVNPPKIRGARVERG